MVSKIIHVKTKVEDLRLGDKYVDWAVRVDEEGSYVYSAARRILNIKTKGEEITLHLDDVSQHTFKKGHTVVIQEVA